MLGAIESLLSAVVADSMTGTRHDSNQELIGQGIANILTPLFGGFASTGAIARTATSIRNGGNSPLSGIIHAATLVLVIMFAAPLATHIPLATLAAILFVVAWNLSEMHRVRSMLRRAPRADVVILLVTLFLTVFVDLVVAVNIGVILATLHFLRRMAASVEVSTLPEEDLPLNQSGEVTTLPKDVMIFRIDGPFFFAAAESFERALAFTNAQPRVVILSLRRVPFIDMTALSKLEHVMHDLQKRHIRVILTEANTLVTEKLERAGLLDLVGRNHVFVKLFDAIAAASLEQT
jgi:SulP family sulfate permease